mgnify:CR=1 FL=1
MDVRPADILVMKKPHPCGSQTMYVIAGRDGFQAALYRLR